MRIKAKTIPLSDLQAKTQKLFEGKISLSYSTSNVRNRFYIIAEIYRRFPLRFSVLIRPAELTLGCYYYTTHCNYLPKEKKISLSHIKHVSTKRIKIVFFVASTRVLHYYLN